MKSVFRFLSISILTVLCFASLAGTAAAHSTPAGYGGAALSATSMNDTSFNWSGYIATGHMFDKVQGDITLPSVTCTVSGAQSLFWVGFDGYNNSTVEQAGVGAKCNGKTPAYFAWWEMFNADTGTSMHIIPSTILSVKPGNHVAEVVSYTTVKTSGGYKKAYVLQITNTSVKQKTYTTVQSCATGYTCSRNSAEWVTERYLYGNGSYSPLAKFSYNPTLFTYAKASTSTNATLEPISSFNRIALSMVERNTYRPIDYVRPLGNGGTSFGVSWVMAW